VVQTRSRRRRLWPVITAAALLGVAVVAAWALQARYASGAGSSSGDPAPAYSIAVRQGGKTLRTYDLTALHALPQTRVVIDGKVQTGPSLSALLSDAGVTGYREVVVSGAGLRDKGRLVLTSAQVKQRVQIDFADRGTVKVCAPSLYHAQWVRDVLAIDVH
jgi:hypothetical protein